MNNGAKKGQVKWLVLFAVVVVAVIVANQQENRRRSFVGH